MKKSFLTSLCALCTLFFVHAADYTIEPKADGNDAINSRAIPLRYDASGVWGSVSQQIYLASELIGEGAGAGDITAITFYYSASSNIASNPADRNIQIFLMEVPAEQDAFVVKENGKSDFLYVSSTNKTAGTRVYNGVLTTEAVNTDQTKTVKINFDDNFAWDGTSNIVLTVFDLSTTSNTVSAGGFANIRFKISKTETARFLSKKWYSSYGYSDTDDRAAWIADISNNLAGREGEYWTSSASTAVATQTANRSYVNKVDFSITPAAVVIPVPENLSASSITTSSATLSWDAVDGADSYNVRWGKTSGSLDNSDNVATNSIDIDGLDDGETYYFDVQTVKGAGTSAYASEASFNTTAITHIHDGITFSKWSSTSSLPASGNYYLANDVSSESGVTLTGNLNLCLNGHVANIYTNKIVVPSDKTLAIYDNVGGGKITGVVPSEVGAADIYAKALIVVYGGGELDLHQGTIENNFEHDPTDPEDNFSSYAIYSNGTLLLSGDVLINSHDADIYLYSTNVITLDGAISNTEKHTVYKLGGDITYGWSTYMSGEDPRNYFESANSARAVFLDDDEAALRILLRLSESSNNSSISSNKDKVIDVALTRSLTSSQYNTFCLPFNLNNAQLEEIFGVGYDLEEFDHSNYDGETLELIFKKRTELTEGAPYLIKPSVDVVNPYFEGVTIYSGEPGSDDWDANVSVYSTFAPTNLEGGNRNILFLGANNELFWPESDGNIKAFRAYFVLSPGVFPVQARIGRAESETTAIENQKSQIKNQKYIQNGQLFIERNGVIYNAQGQTIK